MAGILGEDGPDPNQPPPNQGVLDYIAGQRAAFQPNYPGEAYTGFGFENAAAQPGMSGYFDLDMSGGYPRIMPHAFSPQEVGAQAGLAPGQIGQGFFPSGGRDAVGYNIPNDRGGFFQTNFGGLPTLGQGLSTNNWRLLGRGPGWVMRQGNYINTLAPETNSGLPLGYDTAFSDTAESGAAGLRRFVAPGAALTGNNRWDAYYWPGASIVGRTRAPFGTNV